MAFMMGEGGDSRGWTTQQARPPGPCHTHCGWLVGGTTAANSINHYRYVNCSYFVIAFCQRANQAMSLSFTDTGCSFKPEWQAGERTARFKSFHVHPEDPSPTGWPTGWPTEAQLKTQATPVDPCSWWFTTKYGWRLTDPERNDPNKPLNGQKCQVEPLSLCWLLQYFNNFIII